MGEVTQRNRYSGCTIIGDGELIVGERVSFGGVVLYLNSSVEIGSDTMIAMNVVIHTSTHDHENHPMWKERIDRPIKIGKHVWIGLNSIILPGSVINDFAVVGAGTVVNGVVPTGAIVAGNPARIIKYRKVDFDAEGGNILYPGVAKKEGFSQRLVKNK